MFGFTRPDTILHDAQYFSQYFGIVFQAKKKQLQVQAERVTTLPPLLPLRLHILVITEMQLFLMVKRRVPGVPYKPLHLETPEDVDLSEPLSGLSSKASTRVLVQTAPGNPVATCTRLAVYYSTRCMPNCQQKAAQP